MSDKENFFAKFTPSQKKEAKEKPRKTYLIRDAKTFKEEELSLDDIRGKDGIDGAKGDTGLNGKDGRGISNAEIDNFGHLAVIYDDGKRERIGKVVGKDGVNGRDGQDGITGAAGIDGISGADGLDGLDGRGIDDAGINSKGELEILFSDGEKKNLGRVVGRDGVNTQTVVGGKVIDTAGLGLTGQMFRSIAVAGQPTVNAKNYRDTLTLVQGTNMTITTNAANKTVTFSSTGSGGSIPKSTFSIIG